MPTDFAVLVGSQILAVAALGALAWQVWARRRARRQADSLARALEEGRRSLAGLRARVRLDARVMRIHARLDAAPADEFDAALRAGLADLADALEARRVTLLLHEGDQGLVMRASAPADPGTPLAAEAAHWLRRRMASGEVQDLEVAALATEAPVLAAWLRARGARTALAGALASRGAPLGVLLAEHAGRARTAPEDARHTLARAAEAFGPALAHRRAEAGAREEERQLATVLEHAPVAIFVLDPRGRVRFARGRALEEAGIRAEEILGSSAFDLLADSPQLLTDLERGLAGRSLVSELVLGSRVFDARLQPVGGAQGAVEKLVLVVTDTTERHRAEERLQRQTLYDPLTGLPNRTLFADRLAQRLARENAAGRAAGALLLLDLDRFVSLHDALGTASADRYLRHVARLIRDSFPEPATVARVGVDEFVVHAPAVRTPEEARTLGRDLQSTLRRGILHEGRELHGSASIGIALAARPRRDVESWLREAHTAMVVAKRRGGGTEELFLPVMHTRMLSTWKMEEELNRAISRDEIEAWFQPIVRLSDGAPIGFEALARWRHAEAGMIPPGQFIPVAEDNGMISAIGWIMLRHACRRLREVHEAEPTLRDLYVSVNVSPRQLADAHFLQRVEQALRRERLEPRHLQLEITERDAVGPDRDIVPVLRALRERGVRVSLDDFGTGYSSLSYLNSLPAQTMKVDRSFVVHMDASPAGRKIITAILLLAQGLDLKAIAEGIETEAQRRQLLELGCELGQGYLFARPLAAADLPDYLARARDARAAAAPGDAGVSGGSNSGR